MKDKIVLIIGAGPGLGSSLAQKFSQSGYHVFASRRERNKKPLQNLAKGINKKNSYFVSFFNNFRIYQPLNFFYIRVEAIV